jgi:hypothetical protein
MGEELTEDQKREAGQKAAREGNAKLNNDRLERLNQIANQSDELKNEDGMEDIPDVAWKEPGKQPAEGPEDEARVVMEAEEQDKAQDEARDAGATDIKQVNGETYYQLIVNGQEKWLTLAQLREKSAKIAAADEYLHNAKESAKKAESLIPSQEDESESTRKARTREVIARVQMGDAEAAEELAQLIDARPSRVTPDVLQAVDERIGSQLSFRDDADWFRREYKAEWDDPTLNARIMKRDKEMAQLYPTMNYRERLKEVGDEARAMRIAKAKPEPLKDNPKEARKAQVRALPVAATRMADEPDEGEEETYESAIANIAKARGQGRPIIHKR